MINIAIFASGTGSNARKIIEYFEDSAEINVALIISNKRTAKVLELADEYGVSTLVMDKQYFYDSIDLVNILKLEKIDLVILAGFLWLIPTYLIQTYPDRIINIHPALLPKYGGKGMYGLYVHEAVKQAKESKSGLTIHLVNEQYDKGEILFQAKCQILESDTVNDIATKVLALEHKHYPAVIEKFVREKLINN